MGRPSNRQRILDAAVALAERDGIRGVTVESVATEAGLTKGGVQYHFATKEEMMAAVVETIWDEAEQRSQDHLAVPFADSSTVDRLEAMIRASAGAEARAGELRLFLDSAREPALLDVARRHYDRWASKNEHELTAEQRIALLAADGLWLREAAGVDPFVGQDRQALIEAVVRLARGGRALTSD